MIVYKVNLGKMLHDAGYNPDEVIGSNAGDTEKGSPIKLKIEVLEKVCDLLELQPGVIMENVIKYNIIDIDERNAREEMKEYTFEELKKFFEPTAELKKDAPELEEKWGEIKDLDDLEEYLKFEADGMQVHYKIVPVKE